MQVFANIIFILYFCNVSVIYAQSEEYKLEQLQVLFRHGDRTASEEEIFEIDPNNEIYEKYGYNQLTKIGMERAYKIGQILRKRYDTFLGEYKNDKVYAYSTDEDRTKMTLQLALASLYPSTPSTSWNDSINWQPIPTHYDQGHTSFLNAAFFCPVFRKLLVEAIQKFQLLREYETFLRDMENKSHIGISTHPNVTWVYNNLRSAVSLGLPLPYGFSLEDFQKFEQVVSVASKAMTCTEPLRRIMAGPMVERFLKVFKENESTRKIDLYCGHDYDLSAFIHGHNITGTPNPPDYGSAIILEKLRGHDHQSYIRMYMWTGVSEKLIPLKVDNCGKLCLLSDYQKIVQSILPDEASRVCSPANVVCRP